MSLIEEPKTYETYDDFKSLNYYPFHNDLLNYSLSSTDDINSTTYPSHLLENYNYHRQTSSVFHPKISQFNSTQIQTGSH